MPFTLPKLPYDFNALEPAIDAKTMEIHLTSGSVAITPAGSTTAGPAINAPMQIEVTPQGVKTLSLTQDQYNGIKAQLVPTVPTS